MEIMIDPRKIANSLHPNFIFLFTTIIGSLKFVFLNPFFSQITNEPLKCWLTVWFHSNMRLKMLNRCTMKKKANILSLNEIIFCLKKYKLVNTEPRKSFNSF